MRDPCRASYTGFYRVRGYQNGASNRESKTAASYTEKSQIASFQDEKFVGLKSGCFSK